MKSRRFWVRRHAPLENAFPGILGHETRTADTSALLELESDILYEEKNNKISICQKEV